MAFNRRHLSQIFAKYATTKSGISVVAAIIGGSLACKIAISLRGYFHDQERLSTILNIIEYHFSIFCSTLPNFPRQLHHFYAILSVRSKGTLTQ